MGEVMNKALKVRAVEAEVVIGSRDGGKGESPGEIGGCCRYGWINE